MKPEANRDVLLRGRDITRRWGGLVAVDRVSLELERGSVHAVIGTNGAGKSTLINILSGEIPPSDGSVELLGQDVTALDAAAARARRPGPQLPAQHHLPELHGVRELPPRRAGAHAEALGLVAATRSAARPAPPRRATRPRAPAWTTCSTARPACSSHGQKRQLEIAMCLATAPEVLLLDEPLAGMGAEETERMLALLAELKRRPRDPARRARHGRGVPHRRPHHGDGQRRGDRLATRRRRSAPTRRCRRPTWETTDVKPRRSILDARGLHAWYGSSHVLHGVDLQIARGETVGLLGRNGMGKSTLIRTLLGHVTQRDGHIRLFGQDVSQGQAARGGAPGRGLRARGPRRVPQPERCARTW